MKWYVIHLCTFADGNEGHHTKLTINPGSVKFLMLYRIAFDGPPEGPLCGAGMRPRRIQVPVTSRHSRHWQGILTRAHKPRHCVLPGQAGVMYHHDRRGDPSGAPDSSYERA